MTVVPDPYEGQQLDANGLEDQYARQALSDPVSALSQATNLTAYRKVAPALAPSVLMSFASAGVDPTSDQFLQLSKLFLPTNYDNIIRYGVTPTQQKVLASAPPAVVASARDLYGDALTKVRDSGGWSWNPMDLPGEVAHGAVEEVVKPTVRGVGLAFQAGYEGLQQAARTVEHFVPAGNRIGGYQSDPHALLHPWDALTVYQGLVHHKDLGTGYFPASGEKKRTVGFDDQNAPIQESVPTAGSAAADAQRASGSIAGHVATPGRIVAATVTEPGTKPYNVISGLTDAAVALKDPTASALSDVWKSSRAARTTFSLAPEALGAYSGLRKFAHAPTASQFLDSGKGQQLLSAFARTDSATEIMERTGFKWPVEVADAVAKADTPEDVRAALEHHLGTDIKDIPRVGWLGGVGGTSYALNYPLRNTRFFQDFPGRVFDRQDPDGFVKNLNDYLLNAKVPEDQRHRVVNDAISAFGDAANDTSMVKNAVLKSKTDQVVRDAEEQIHRKVAGDKWWSTVDSTPSELEGTIHEGRSARELVDGLVKVTGDVRTDPADEVRTALEHTFPGADVSSDTVDRAVELASARDRGALANYLKTQFPMGHSYAGDEYARRLTTYSDRSKDLTQYALDADSPGGIQHIDVGGQSIPIDGVHLSSELANRAYLLPDPREIRRTVSALGPLFVRPDGAATPIGVMADALTAAQSNLWKPLVVLRGALTVRILAEEQAAMATGGMDSIFRHPLGYIAHSIGVKSDLLGRPFQEQLADRGSTWARALATAYSGDADRLHLSGFGRVFRGDENFIPSWAGEVNQLGAAPEARAAAQAVLDNGGWSLSEHGQAGPAVADFQKRLWEGDLKPVREAIMGDQPFGWRHVLNTKEGSDAWAQSIIARVSRVSGNDEALTKAIATGRIGGGLPIEPELADAGMDGARARAARLGPDEPPVPEGKTRVYRGENPATPVRRADEVGQSYSRDRVVAERYAGPDGTVHAVDVPNNELHDLSLTGPGTLGDDVPLDAVNAASRFTVRDGLADHSGVTLGAQIGTGQGPSSELLSHLRKLDKADVTPEMVKGRIYGRELKSASAATRTMGRLNYAEDAMWNALVGIPSRTLSRSPIYRQSYYGELARLFPAMDEETQAAVRSAMENNGLANAASKLSGAAATGDGALNMASADLLASKAGLKRVRDLTYDLHNRKQWADVLRVISPFADAWRQIAGRWAGLALENGGMVIHRAQQATQAARQSGFFYPDPATGKEMFVIPGTGWLEQKLTGYDLGGFSAPVAGLNLTTQGLPGLGPAGTIAVDKLLPHTPTGDSMRQLLTPFGGPDTSHGIAEAFFPGWLQKVIGAGALNGLSLGVLKGGHENDQRQFASNYGQATQWLLANDKSDPTTGLGAKYAGASTPEGADALHKDAIALARKLQTLQGLVQFISPAAPHARFSVPVGDHSAELFTISEDYRKMQQEAIATGGDPNLATRQFIDRYGPNLMMSMVPQSVPTVYGLAPTTESSQWRTEHGDIASKYPDVWPLLAPQHATDKFSYFEYGHERETGQRAPIDTDQRLELAQYRVGAMLYDLARAQLPTTPNDAQRQQLAIIRNRIGQRFPGYASYGFQEPPYASQKADRDTAAAQLAAAADAPGVDPQLAEAIQTYTRLRTEALGALGPNTAGSALGEKRAATIRAQLRSYGEAILSRVPQFAPAWENLYGREVEEPVVTQPTETVAP